MITVDSGKGRLTVTDVEKNELTVRVRNWEPLDEKAVFHRPVDARVAGLVAAIRFPEAGVCVHSDNNDQWQSFVSDPGPLILEDDTHVIQVETKIAAYIRFTGPATIHRHAGHVDVSFPARTPVTIGFKSRVRKPTETITIPPALDGIASGITALSSAIETTSPERSYSTIRRHPPVLTLGDELDVPSAVRDAIPDTGIEFHLPRELDIVFSAAPLAYYLQASIRFTEADVPSLVDRAEATVIHRFDSNGSFQFQCAAFLKHVFYLDCLVRNVGPWGTNLAELRVLDEINLNPSTAYHDPPPVRLRHYANIAPEQIAPEFPQWHLAMYVDPTIENAVVLPHILDRLGVIYQPQTQPLSKRELLDRSVSDAYASAKPRAVTTTPSSITPVLPVLHDERVHGWIADEVPIDVFKLAPVAFTNRFGYQQTGAEPLDFTIVLNDDEMQTERDVVTEIYTERAADLSIDLSIHSDVSTQALTRIFEQPTDFVHYIGHCDTNGLKCADGYLKITDIEQSNAKTFFLNACNSYREGIELITKGSIAGGVTLNQVFDTQATKIGSTFARLLVYGFSIEQALQIARKQTLTNKHYLVVGDGTYALAQGDDVCPTITLIEDADSGKYQITTGVFSANNVGGFYQSYNSNNELKYLFGNRNSFYLSQVELIDYLKSANAAIIYKDSYFWSEALCRELSKWS